MGKKGKEREGERERERYTHQGATLITTTSRVHHHIINTTSKIISLTLPRPFITASAGMTRLTAPTTAHETRPHHQTQCHILHSEYV